MYFKVKMLESKLVPQTQFTDVQQFKIESNNFYLFFQEGQMGDMYRTKEVYQRFKTENPTCNEQLCQKAIEREQEYKRNEQERFQEVVQISIRDRTVSYDKAWEKCKPAIEKYPWKELFEAYQIMSKLVYQDDKGVTRENGTLDDVFLCR